MSTRQQHFVTFYSPGTFLHEETTKPVESWDIPTAVRMAVDITERHGARPFAFRFETRTVADDIDDGEGGKLKVQPRLDRVSGRHYIGGVLLSQDDIERQGPRKTLLANMRSNGWDYVVEVTNGYTTTQPFEAGDVLVDHDGRVVQ